MLLNINKNYFLTYLLKLLGYAKLLIGEVNRVKLHVFVKRA